MIVPPLRLVPQWSAVAIDPPLRPVRVELSWTGGRRDVTDDHAIASLRPLAIALPFDAGETPSLDFSERDRGLGTLRLTRWKAISPGVTLYRVAAGEHRCLPWPWRGWQEWRQRRAAARSRQAHNFSMDPAAMRHLMICYIRPRPVALVSVAGPGHFNVFPMDLIGSLGSRIGLALRETNISIPVMRGEGRIVLADLPAAMTSTAYELGAHHKSALAGPDALPFATRPSPLWEIPAPIDGLRLRELAIRQAEPVGSHIFFLADILSDGDFAEGRQLHHVAGFYDLYRRRRGDAFPRASGR